MLKLGVQLVQKVKKTLLRDYVFFMCEKIPAYIIMIDGL